MRFFLATQYIEDRNSLELCTIAIVDERGRKLHLGNQNYLSWITNSSSAKATQLTCMTPGAIADEVFSFIGGQIKYDSLYSPEGLQLRGDSVKRTLIETPEIWGCCSAYDWVVLCRLYGSKRNLPPTFPQYCKDIQQLYDLAGFELPPKPDNKPTLFQAHWCKEAFNSFSRKLILEQHNTQKYLAAKAHRQIYP